MTGTPLLELAQVSVRFGGQVALEGVTLRIHAGECVVLVGPNGSGKTTLLRVLHGQLPHAGQRRVLGPADARQAMVFQRPFLLRLSVLNNLRVALWLAGVPRAERTARAEAALARAGLSDLRRRPARVLSWGQQRRLVLARAWAAQPAVLFLDEPTASLDPPAQREVEELIAQFAREGLAIVMSTHDLGQARRLGTRVAYLEAGRVVVDLPSAAFFDQPLPTAAAQFVHGGAPWSG